jgi:hypothetical protein
LNLRVVVFLVFLANFILALIGIASLPSALFKEIGLVMLYLIITSLSLVLLSYWVWMDGEKLDKILCEAEKPIKKEVSDIEELREKAMSSIKESVGAAYYTQAIALISRYSKHGFLHPELVLDDKIKEKMAKGKTMAGNRRII